MKKLSIATTISCFLILLSACSSEFDTLTPTAFESTPIDKESQELIEIFLVANRNGNFAEAYAYMGLDFKENHTEEEIEEMARILELDDFIEKRWLTVDRSNPNLHAKLRGEFTGDSVQHVNFVLIEEDGSLKLGAIEGEFSLNQLWDWFPKNDSLETLIKDEIELLNASLDSGNYRDYYLHFSDAAQKAIDVETIESALQHFKNEDKDLSFGIDSKLKIAEGYPLIEEDGTVYVKGEFNNENFRVYFTFGYRFEWEWKLHSLDIDAEALN